MMIAGLRAPGMSHNVRVRIAWPAMEARSAKPKQNDGLIVEQCARYDSAQSRRLATSSTTAEGMDAKVSGWRAQYATSTALQTTKVTDANSFPTRWISRRRGSRLAAFRSCTSLIAKAIPEATAMIREKKSCSKSNVKSKPARHEDATMGPRSASLHGFGVLLPEAVGNLLGEEALG